jgi:hypothetical protein
MSILIFSLFTVFGLFGIFNPKVFYKSSALTQEKIMRNNRIWKRCGIGLVLVGIAGLMLELL